MLCTEYIYNETEAKELFAKLKTEGFENVKIFEGLDEDANEKCWEVSWQPKPLKK